MVVNKAEEILSSLNDDQRAAASHIEGPCFVIAGPGSGKTHTIVQRSQYMICNGVRPDQIVLFTFTNKAAREIKERVVSKIGPEAKEMVVGTYHSVCSRYILRRYADVIGYTNSFTIVMPEDTEKLVKLIIKKFSYETDFRSVWDAIANYKKEAMSPNEAINSALTNKEKLYSQVYKAYQDELFRTNCMDFDDLLLNSIKILERHPDIKRAINQKWQYISADEAHDSSKVDLRLIELLAGDNENVCFILDQDQSIYGFRGANIEAVINAKDIFNNTKIYNLSYNYRSTKLLVEASKSLIKVNPRLLPKEVNPARDRSGAPIVVTPCRNQKDEAAYAARYIKFLVEKKDLEYKDIAILYRNNDLSRNVEAAMLENKIPYHVVGTLQFFKRKEIQDILSYLRLLINQHDEAAYRRCSQAPKRGIGEKTVDAIVENAIMEQTSIRESARILGAKKQYLLEFDKQLNDLTDQMVELSPAPFIEYLIEKVGYYAHIEKDKDVPFEERKRNIGELINFASEFENFEDMLLHVTLQMNTEEDEDSSNKVDMMTMHASKGLEYKAVIIIGVNDRVIPSYRALDDERDIQEERRLFYVAMTRAKDYLFILHPNNVTMGGRSQFLKRSQFIEEINPHFIKFTDQGGY